MEISELVLVRSRYLEIVKLDTGSSLCVHTLQQARAVLLPEVVDLLNSFEQPRQVGEWVPQYSAEHALGEEKVLQCVKGLLDAKMLYDGTPEAEERTYQALLSQLFGRDPEAARRAALRFASQQVPRFAAPAPRSLESFAPLERRLDVVLVGLCEVQVGMDVLRSMARESGLDLRLIPTFESTIEMLKETPHDAVVVGPLSARLGLWHRADGGADLAPDRYTGNVRRVLEQLRELTEAPIVVQNLPVPTVSPLGFADRGPDSLRERARHINRDLVEIVDGFPDVYVLDVDAALSYEGKKRLLDDRVVSFGHLGGLGWWTLLPAVELNSVHGIRPPLERLSELGVSDPFEFDRAIATDLISLLGAIFGVGRRTTVVVDVDGVLWPGSLEKTRSPFPGKLDYTTLSYHAFFLGIHEALKALRGRGVLLGAIGRSEETRVLWKFPSRSPLERLMLPEDFMALRLNGEDPVAKFGSLCEELEAKPEEAVFVSADPEARARVAERLPKALVLGDNPFSIRGDLLTHPSLQVSSIREESTQHKEMVVALFERERARRKSEDKDAFVTSLDLQCTVRGRETEDLDRVYDLVLRTNQFTTTARRYSRKTLYEMARGEGVGRLFTLWVKDRFTDYGLVGVAVAEEKTLELVLLACRVVGLGVENVLLRAVIADLLESHEEVRGRLLELDENLPARAFFKNNGFAEDRPGLWALRREDAATLPPLTPRYAITLEDVRVPPGFPLVERTTP